MTAWWAGAPANRKAGWGGGGAVNRHMKNGEGMKVSLLSRCRGGGQYKMYNSLIFINFISKSEKVKPKSKSCIKHLFTVNKLLRLWYFVSVLNLKFLDQLERRHCKDTPFLRPFYNGAPKGPFLWGLKTHFLPYYKTMLMRRRTNIMYISSSFPVRVIQQNTKHFCLFSPPFLGYHFSFLFPSSP